MCLLIKNRHIQLQDNIVIVKNGRIFIPPNEKRCIKMLFQKFFDKKGKFDWNCIDKCKNKIERVNKNERKRSLCTNVITSPIVMLLRGASSEKVSLYALKRRIKKASLAVETAMALPIFFLGMVTMISFMDIYGLQTVHLQTLCEKAKETGMYAYAVGQPKEITLPDVYSYSPVGALIKLPKVWMHNTVKVHTWVGADTSDYSADNVATEEMVYVTASGTVYHTNAGCRYLNVSINSVSGSSVPHMKNNNGERYSACEICSKNQKPSGIVYITAGGNRYHNLSTCSGLKRTVMLVKESDVSNMHACSHCG